MSNPTEHEQNFTGYLAGLVPPLGEPASPEQRATLAALRRGLGKKPGEAPEMFPYVIPRLPDNFSSLDRERYFLIASLFAAHQISWTPDNPTGRESNFGASFRKLSEKLKQRTGSNNDKDSSTEKRFVALLNAEHEDLPEHLRHAVSLFKAHDIAVDWAQLLHDVRKWEWDAEDRHVHNAWARAFWSSFATPIAATANAPTTR